LPEFKQYVRRRRRRRRRRPRRRQASALASAHPKGMLWYGMAQHRKQFGRRKCKILDNFHTNCCYNSKTVI